MSPTSTSRRPDRGKPDRGRSGRGGPGRARRVLSGLTALTVLLATLVGVPLLLAVLGGNPLPDHVPSVAEIGNALTSPDDGTLFLRVLTVAGWVGWATFALSVLVELPAAVRRRPAPRLPGLRAQQRVAATLIAAVALIGSSSAMASAAVPAASPAPTTAATAPAAAYPAAAGTMTMSGGAAPWSSAVSRDALPPLPVRVAHDGAGLPGSGGSPGSTARQAPAGGSTYVVAPGDRLVDIAARFLGDSGRYPELARAIGLSDADEIRPGQLIVLPTDARDRGPSQYAAGHLEMSAGDSYVVAPDDRLSDVAERFLGDADRYPELATGSGVQDPDEIRPGQRIQLPPESHDRGSDRHATGRVDDPTPDSQAPDSQAPDSQAPDSQAPDGQSPGAESPGGESPDRATPGGEAPDATPAPTPDAKVPDATPAPGGKAPDARAPGATPTPDATAPAMPAPGGKAPDATPGPGGRSPDQRIPAPAPAPGGVQQHDVPKNDGAPDDGPRAGQAPGPGLPTGASGGSRPDAAQPDAARSDAAQPPDTPRTRPASHSEGLSPLLPVGVPLAGAGLLAALLLARGRRQDAFVGRHRRHRTHRKDVNDAKTANDSTTTPPRPTVVRDGFIAAPPRPRSSVEPTAISHPDANARLDAALRTLAIALTDRSPDEMPDVTGAWIEQDTIRLILDRPCPNPPAPWTGSELSWELPAGGVLPDTTGVPAPLPMLVTVGTRGSCPLLLDLERLGVLTLTGDAWRADDLLRYIGAELAGNPWSDDLEILVAGFDSAQTNHLAMIGDGRIEPVPTVADGISRMRRRVSQALGIEPDSPGRHAAREEIDDEWAPTVLLASDPDLEETIALGELDAELATTGRCGVGIVASISGDLGRWPLKVTEDGTMSADFLGFRSAELLAARLSPPRLGSLAEMFVDSALDLKRG